MDPKNFLGIQNGPRMDPNGPRMCHEERHTFTHVQAHQGLDTRTSEVHPNL